MEFLVDMVTTVPDGTSDDAVADMRIREAGRAAELASQGSLPALLHVCDPSIRPPTEESRAHPTAIDGRLGGPAHLHAHSRGVLHRHRPEARPRRGR